MGTTKHCKTKQQVGQTILAVSYKEVLTIPCLPEKRPLIEWKISFLNALLHQPINQLS
ncbi:MAG: hypothetical protein LBE37_15575 [Sphingobacterium sp.]|jgi:hypothetical protein|nr:hypothetical protein [Sphingobacterium sp.]